MSLKKSMYMYILKVGVKTDDDVCAGVEVVNFFHFVQCELANHERM